MNRRFGPFKVFAQLATSVATAGTLLASVLLFVGARSGNMPEATTVLDSVALAMALLSLLCGWSTWRAWSIQAPRNSARPGAP